MKQRGQSQLISLVNSQTKPIFIDDQASPRQGRYINTVATISPLPAFDQNNQLTKLLYSKFIVKGVKPFNHELMLSKLKENNQHHPSRKTTRETTHCTKEYFVRDSSGKRDIISDYKQQKDQSPVFDFSIGRSLHRDHLSLANLNKNVRPSSGFQRSNNQNSKRPQSASMKLLHRPQSAYTSRPVSASSRNQATQRPQSSLETALVKKKAEYYEQELQTSSKILRISQSNPKIKAVDYIQKNKREASSRKKSIYLTVSEAPNYSKVQRASKAEKDREAIQQPIIKRQTLTKAEKELITAKQRDYLQYMKKNMPIQYQQCIQFLLGQSQEGEQLSYFMVSCSLGQEEPTCMNPKQIEEFQVQQFYKDFLNKCLNIEHNIKHTQIRKQQPQLISTILNCDQTQHILQIFKEVQQLRQNGSSYHQHSNQIRQIIKNLTFFRQIRKQVLKSIFEMNYQILSFQQNQVVIAQKSEVKYVYIILNGSVRKQNTRQQNQSMLLDQVEPPEYLTTLFDGEIFGLPSKNDDKCLPYSIRTIEKCLFMLLPYQSYRLALSNNQNIEDRIELLELIFPRTAGKYRLTKEDYETIAYQMDTAIYAAQEVIVREGERRDQLMFVAAGKAAICFESVIKRKKEDINPLEKNRKQIIRQIPISQLRRSNLVNYSLMFQNAFEKHYYLNQTVETKIRGDVWNWKCFHQALTTNESEKLVSQQPFQHSLISIHDNTKLYLLSPSKVVGLSEHIREYISQKAKENSTKAEIKRDQQSIDKWEAFKIKVCKEILAKKGNK